MLYTKTALLAVCAMLIFTFTACNVTGNDNSMEGNKVQAPTYESNNMGLLQGTWQDVFERENRITFVGDTKRDEFPGVKINDVKYTVSDHCGNPSNVNTNKLEDRYITVLSLDQCFFINSLTESKLELTQVGQSSKSKYRKVK